MNKHGWHNAPPLPTKSWAERLERLLLRLHRRGLTRYQLRTEQREQRATSRRDTHPDGYPMEEMGG